MNYLEGYDIDRACKQFEFNEEHIACVAKQVPAALLLLVAAQPSTDRPSPSLSL